MELKGLPGEHSAGWWKRATNHVRDTRAHELRDAAACLPLRVDVVRRLLRRPPPGREAGRLAGGTDARALLGLRPRRVGLRLAHLAPAHSPGQGEPGPGTSLDPAGDHREHGTGIVVSSERTIDRILIRKGLVRQRPRKRPRESHRRFERPGPMQLWVIDIVGGIRLVNPVTGELRETRSSPGSMTIPGSV